jgi:hypothetical protein
MTVKVVRTRQQHLHARANAFSAQQILNAFREKLSVPRLEVCSSCGSALVQRQGRLSIYGTDEGVTISIGFCEWCEGAAPNGPLQ